MRLIGRTAMSLSLICISLAHAGRYILRRVFQEQRDVHGVRIILTRKGKVVLVRHWYAPGIWTLPGGGVEPYESDETAAIREAREEVGYTVNSLEGEVGTYEGIMGKHDVVKVFYTSDYEGGLKVVPDWEIQKRGIFDLDNLPETLSPANRTRIQSFINGVRGERGKW